MITVVLRALLVSIATSLDELPVLFLLYRKEGKQKGSVTVGYLLGSLLLILLAAVGALGLRFLRHPARLGLIGLLPLIMGLRLLWHGEDEQDETEEALQAGKRWKRGLVQVTVISLAMGVDDLGVYIPLFSTQPWAASLQMGLVLMLTAALYCVIASRLSSIQAFNAFLEEYERYLVAAIFVLVGLWVLIENGTFTWLWSLIT